MKEVASNVGTWAAVFMNYAIITGILAGTLLKKKLPRNIWRFREAGNILIFLLAAGLAFSGIGQGMLTNIWRVYDSIEVAPVETEKETTDEVLDPGESTEITDGAFTFRVENTGDVSLGDIQIVKNTDTPPTPPVDVDSPIEYELDQPVKSEDVEQAIKNIFDIVKSILTVLIVTLILYELFKVVVENDAHAYQAVRSGVVMLICLSLITPLTESIRGAASQSDDVVEVQAYPVRVAVTNTGSEPLTEIEMTLHGRLLEPAWANTLDELPAGKSNEAVVYLASEDEVRQISVSARTDAHTQAVGKYASPLFGYCVSMGAISAIFLVAHLIRNRHRKMWLFWLMRTGIYAMLALRIIEGTRFPLIEIGFSAVVFSIMCMFKMDLKSVLDVREEMPHVAFAGYGLSTAGQIPKPQISKTMNVTGDGSGAYNSTTGTRKKKKRRKNKKK